MQLDALKQLLNNLSQPAVLTQDETVLYANRPAEEKMLLAGTPLKDCRIGENLFLLLGTEYEAGVQQVDAYTLYFLSPAKNTVSLSPAVFHAALKLRESLTSLFSVSSSLFPKLEELENPKIQDDLSHINRSFFRLMRLACNLSDLYAAQDGHMRLYYQKTEMTDFIYGIFSRVEPLCKLCGIRLKLTLHPTTFFAWIDRQKTERLILNLFSNAMKYSEKGSEISLELGKLGSFAVVSVRDCGEGISDEILSDAYFRFDRPLCVEDARAGLGAGLSLCRKISELHGGSIFLSPMQPHGTCVSVRLPLGKPSDEALVESPLAKLDYTGGLSHELVELSDVLPSEVFDTENVN